MILSRRSIIAWSVESSRLTPERALTALVFVDVWYQSQCKSGVTLCSIPKDVALAETRLHALIGVKKGDPNNRCMSDSGAMAVLQTATVSDVAVPYGIIFAPGPVVAKVVLSSVMVGAGTLRTVIQS